MRVALVYDRVNKIGGAERILAVLHEIWPQAPLYTAVYNPKTAPWAQDFKVIPSFLQKFPLAKTNHEWYPWLTPLAFESFNFDEYDVVISVTTEAAKGIITKPKTLHICYCLTPTRYLWSHYDIYFPRGLFRWLTTPVVAYLRAWDKIASQRPDYFIALSENVKARIKKYYGRDSEVIYPPVTLIANSAWHVDKKTTRQKPQATSYFLIVSRLVPYKRIDIAIEAFNQLGLPLKIVGTGSELGKLKRMAKGNIEFVPELTEGALLRYYQGCQALIFPQDEDLGLTPIETQACGRPVIAFRGGGALETIIEGKTGEFFYPQTAEALIGKLEGFNSSKYKKQDCAENAKKFSLSRFKREFMGFISEKYKEWKSGGAIK